MTLDINKKLIQQLEDKLQSTNIDVNDYIENLIKKDLQSNFVLANGFSFNLNNNRLYNKEDKEVNLTSKPLMILKCLIINKGSTISTEEISSYVWGKNASVFTIRNMIKQIRDNTYDDIITSIRNKGYSLKD